MALLVTVTMILAYRWRDRPRLATAALFGAMIALAALARGEGILLLPLLAVPWILLTRDAVCEQCGWRHLAVTVARMSRRAGTVDDPQRDHVREVRAAVDQRQRGDGLRQLCVGLQRTVRRLLGLPVSADGSARRRASRPATSRRSRLYWRSLGFDYARDHAGELPRVVTLRVLRQWELFRPLQNVNLGGIEGRNHDASTMGLMMFYGLAGLSIVGAVSMRRRRIPLLPIGVQFLSVTITSAYTYGSVRFRAPGRAGAVRARRGRSRARRRAGAALAGTRVRSMTRRLRGDGAPSCWAARVGCGRASSGAWQPRRAGDVGRDRIGAARSIALPLRGLYHTTGGTMEEAFMMVFPERMLKGDLPNRDFLHLYGPGALQVLAGLVQGLRHLAGVRAHLRPHPAPRRSSSPCSRWPGRGVGSPRPQSPGWRCSTC